MELKELNLKMAEAIANNDTKAIEELASQIVKSKAERHKAEAEAQAKEAEAMARAREELAKEIRKAVKALELDKRILEVKSTGFTYTCNRTQTSDGKDVFDGSGEVRVTGACNLMVPAVKVKRTGGGGGGASGKTKDEYGLSLAEVYDKYHTAEDDAKLAEAELKDKEASEKLGKTTNSNAWRVKNEVKKRVIADGSLQPQK